MGDLSSNTALSVDSELAVFSGTTGKLLKRGTGSGLALLTSGVLSIKAAPTGAVVGTTDTQTLTGKTIAGASNTLNIREADLVLTDVTTRDVSLSQHGFVPKALGGPRRSCVRMPPGPSRRAGWRRADGCRVRDQYGNGTLSAERVLTDTATVTWDRTTPGQIKATAAGVGGYTNEEAQDAVGTILTDTATIDLIYTDATPAITADVRDASITYAKIQSVTDTRLLGRSAGSAGVTQELTVGAGLSLSAGVLTSTITQYTTELAQDAIGTCCSTPPR